MKISIVSLIYRSTKFCDAVYESVMKYTPLILSGDAEFFFIANDPEPHLLQHLKDKKYKHYVNINKKLTNEQLFNIGIGTPEYINRVYKGWNEAIKRSTGEVVVLINSDNMLSPNWLENLIKNLDKNMFVCSEIVERDNHPKFAPYPNCLVGNFGNHPNNFLETEFLNFVKEKSQNSVKEGGAYMPCAFYKDVIMKVGMYPEGNLHNGHNFYSIKEYGDENLINKLKQIGIKHITALDSISYHFKEGEMLE